MLAMVRLIKFFSQPDVKYVKKLIHNVEITRQSLQKDFVINYFTPQLVKIYWEMKKLSSKVFVHDLLSRTSWNLQGEGSMTITIYKH